jgi:hypothetical protein
MPEGLSRDGLKARKWAYIYVNSVNMRLRYDRNPSVRKRFKRHFGLNSHTGV